MNFIKIFIKLDDEKIKFYSVSEDIFDGIGDVFVESDKLRSWNSKSTH